MLRWLTRSKHFHPADAFGAHSFAGAATCLINRAQADDLTAKGTGYIGMFSMNHAAEPVRGANRFRSA